MPMRIGEWTLSFVSSKPRAKGNPAGSRRARSSRRKGPLFVAALLLEKEHLAEVIFDPRHDGNLAGKFQALLGDGLLGWHGLREKIRSARDLESVFSSIMNQTGLFLPQSAIWKLSRETVLLLGGPRRRSCKSPIRRSRSGFRGTAISARKPWAACIARWRRCIPSPFRHAQRWRRWRGGFAPATPRCRVRSRNATRPLTRRRRCGCWRRSSRWRWSVTRSSSVRCRRRNARVLPRHAGVWRVVRAGSDYGPADWRSLRLLSGMLPGASSARSPCRASSPAISRTRGSRFFAARLACEQLGGAAISPLAGL